MRTYSARWVLPVATPAIADGAIAVDGGRLAYVGPAAGAPPGPRVDLGDAVLMPGLVNAHTHLELTAMRGFLEALAFRPWIVELTRARQAVLPDALLRASARVGIAEGLLAGITTFADTCASGVVLPAMVEMGVRGVMYQEVFGPDPAQCDASLEGLRARLRTLRPLATPTVRLGVSPHAPYTVSDSLFAAVTRVATDEDLPMAIHLAESEDEDRLVRFGDGAFADGLRARGIAVAARAPSPVALLERLGVLAARPLLIHCVRTDGAEARTLAAHDCAIAHCPASNAKLGHGVAPLSAWRAAGIRVGLGTDSVASNNRLDLLDEARLAILLQRGMGRRHDTLAAAEALALATLGGARALGLEATVGSLEVGKAADVAAFALRGARAVPAFAPEDALVWAMAGRGAELVLVAGEERVREGRLVAPVDEDEATVRAAARALAAWRTREGAARA